MAAWDGRSCGECGARRARPTILERDDWASPRGSTAMKKYLVLYRSTMSAADIMAGNTPEQGKAEMAAWMEWAQRAGSAIVDLGTPPSDRRAASAAPPRRRPATSPSAATPSCRLPTTRRCRRCSTATRTSAPRAARSRGRVPADARHVTPANGYAPAVPRGSCRQWWRMCCSVKRTKSATGTAPNIGVRMGAPRAARTSRHAASYRA